MDDLLIKIVFRKLLFDDSRLLGDFFTINNTTETKRSFNPFPLTRETARNLLIDGSMNYFFGAFADDKLIGFSMLRGWDEGYSIPSLGILVDTKYRGKGLGKRLMLFTIEQAKATHCDAIRLSVYKSNSSAYGLYKELGFQEVSRSIVVILDTDDEKIIMLKDLREDH